MKITDVKVLKVRQRMPVTRFAMVYPLAIYEKFRKERYELYEEIVKKKSEGATHIVETTINLVDITTDDGITGRYYAGDELQSYIIEHNLKPLLIGEDPFNIETLWDQMYKVTLPFGRKGAAIMAIGAVDVTLWDIIGKALINLSIGF